MEISTAPAAPAKLVGKHLVVENCPHCGLEHRHGAGGGYGLRSAHCDVGAEGPSLSYVLVPVDAVKN